MRTVDCLGPNVQKCCIIHRWTPAYGPGARSRLLQLEPGARCVSHCHQLPLAALYFRVIDGMIQNLGRVRLYEIRGLVRKSALVSLQSKTEAKRLLVENLYDEWEHRIVKLGYEG